MKVVYKKSIAEQLYEARRDAARALKEIDYVELTEAEWKQLDREVVAPYYVLDKSAYITSVLGIPVRKAVDTSKYST